MNSVLSRQIFVGLGLRSAFTRPSLGHHTIYSYKKKMNNMNHRLGYMQDAIQEYEILNAVELKAEDERLRTMKQIRKALQSMATGELVQDYWLSYDCCVNEDCVFAGSFSKMITCPNCDQRRLMKCNHRSCKKNKYWTKCYHYVANHNLQRIVEQNGFRCCKSMQHIYCNCFSGYISRMWP